MSIWGRIFGTSQAVESMVEGVKSGLDALVYTDEEKATEAAKQRTEARAMVIQWMQATQGQNLARRLIALVITGVWVLQHLAGMLLSVISIWARVPTPYETSARVISESAHQMNGAVMLILGFYFAAPHMGSIAEAALRRFGTVPNRADKPA
ncbi:hypothetical protein [Veronia pacifica]|uniref:Uncharacterized protein n=1 Tax=Veronia pacifica TaxID=1080227 RepID=A0A1C3E9H0_9GAMM|nr:hypothetical protein [Veronia pacifica]ODA29866.1 hypothetical protein A8L45_21440 [Veronia pacifica]